MEPTLRWVITLVEWDETTGAIVNVRWKVEVSDGETTVDTPGACRFDANPTGKDFIPLEGITEDIVLEWVKKQTPNYLGTEKRAMERFKAAKATPNVTGRGIPWAGIDIPKVTPKVY